MDRTKKKEFKKAIENKNYDFLKAFLENKDNEISVIDKTKALSSIITIITNHVYDETLDQKLNKVNEDDMKIIKLLIDHGAEITRDIIVESETITDPEYIDYIFSKVNFEEVMKLEPRVLKVYMNNLFSLLTDTDKPNLENIKKIIDTGLLKRENGPNDIPSQSSSNNKELINLLLDNNFVFSEHRSYGEYINTIDMLNFLLSKGYDMSKDSSIFYNKNIELVKYALNLTRDNGEKIIDLNSQYSLDSFLYLIYRNYPINIKLLLDNGFNLNQYSNNEELTPLVQAIKNIELVKLLLEKGAIASFHNNFAISEACRLKKPNLDIIKLLIEKGATLNEQCIHNLQQSKDPDIKRFIKDETKSFDIAKVCNYDLDLLGDPLEENNNTIVLFNIEGNKQCECITYADWKNILDNQDIKYLWRRRTEENLLSQRLICCRIFKLPFSGVYIQSTYNMLLRYNTFKLIKFNEKQLVATDKLEEVYKAIPIKKRDMLKEITEGVKVKINNDMYIFRPDLNDIQINIPILKDNVFTTIGAFGTFIESGGSSGQTEHIFTYLDKLSFKNYNYERIQEGERLEEKEVLQAEERKDDEDREIKVNE